MEMPFDVYVIPLERYIFLKVDHEWRVVDVLSNYQHKFYTNIYEQYLQKVRFS